MFQLAAAKGLIQFTTEELELSWVISCGIHYDGETFGPFSTGALEFIGSFYVGSIMIIKLLILPERWMGLYHFCIGSIMIMVHPISSTNVLKEVKHQRIKGFCFKSLCCSNWFLFVVSICLLDPVYSLPSVLAFLYDATFGRLVFYNCGEQMTTI